jgi:AcrR family transcriptional regulator
MTALAVPEPRSPEPRSPEPRPRERILETATRLFYRQGYRAVGIDTIIRESGVAKMSLYKHFPSKDDLITAYLEQVNEGFFKWVEGMTSEIKTPRGKLEAIFDNIGARAASVACLGCPFGAAAVEFPELDHPAHAMALKHKTLVLELLQDLSTQAKARDPRALAESLMLVMDGAWQTARMFGPTGHAGRASDAARVLIAAHLK